MRRFETGKLDHRIKSFAWITVQLLETVMCKYAVLIGNGNQVSGDADNEKVQKRDQ